MKIKIKYKNGMEDNLVQVIKIEQLREIYILTRESGKREIVQDDDDIEVLEVRG